MNKTPSPNLEPLTSDDGQAPNLSVPGFYQTSMGRMVRHLISRKLKPAMTGALPAHHHDIDVATLGYARLYLKYCSDHYPRLINLQTTANDLLPWPSPATAPLRQAVVDGHHLPLLDASLDLIMVIHAFETATPAQDMADELWRVLKGQGQLILVVPHRGSMWAGRDDNPFGLGQPYSVHQIKRLLHQHGFDVTKTHQALAAPPSISSFYPRYAPFVERLPNPLGGVLIVEAVKMIYAVRGDRVRSRQKFRLKVQGSLAGVKSPRSS